MAVSFKVPASPKRSIFVIDEFQGVDLTNTGSNIEDTRSPNAENMIRYVPGKVRKRMGYEKDVIFGQDINVNYAKGTSSKEKEIIIGESDVNQWVRIYDLIKRMQSKDGNPFDLYIEFDACIRFRTDFHRLFIGRGLLSYIYVLCSTCKS